MQGGKSASVVESAKEAVANVGASAWAGKEKSKAVVQEKLAKARAQDPGEKAAADARAQERVRAVEAAKQETISRNAATKERHTASVHQPSLPEPPARTIDGRDNVGELPGARLVKARDDGAVPVSAATADAAPNATETGAAATGGHVAGAPETAAVAQDDAPRAAAETGPHP